MKMLGVVLLIGIVAGFFVLKNDGEEMVLDDSATKPEVASLKVAVIDMEKVHEAYESLHMGLDGSVALVEGTREELEQLTERLRQSYLGTESGEDQQQHIRDEIEAISLKINRLPQSFREEDHLKLVALTEKKKRLEEHIRDGDSNREEWLRRRNKAINENRVVEIRKRLSVIGELVSDYGEEAGVDYIFNSSTKRKESPIRSGVLIANDNQMDITEEIIERLKVKLSNKEGDE